MPISAPKYYEHWIPLLRSDPGTLWMAILKREHWVCGPEWCYEYVHNERSVEKIAVAPNLEAGAYLRQQGIRRMRDYFFGFVSSRIERIAKL
jgi:hypothetical protein